MGVMNAGLMYRGAPYHDWIAKIAKASLSQMQNPGGRGKRYVGENDFRLVQIPTTNSFAGSSGSDQVKSYANSSSLTGNMTLAVQWLQEHIEQFSGEAPVVPVVDLFGADARMLQTDSDAVFYIVARHSHKTYTKLWYGEVRVPVLGEEANSRKALAQPLYELEIVTETSPKLEGGRKDQKNWVPFTYKSKLFFVSHIWPFNVVKMAEPHDNNSKVRAVPLGGSKSLLAAGGVEGSHSEHPEEKWVVDMGKELPYIYGFIHGSTPAYQMRNGEYLAFFHAYLGLYPDRVIQTYTMGAFTFRAVEEGGEGQGLEFELTAISSKPIVPHFPDEHSRMIYRGTWLHDHRMYGFADYAIFPVSFTLESDAAGKEQAFVMYCYQNKKNYFARFDVETLLTSLQKV
jgi:hypothetical protein